jgi:chromosome segregation ATPase
MSALSIQVKDLRQELVVAKELHAEQISGFEAQIEELASAKAELDSKIEELTQATAEADEKVNAFETEIEASKAKAEEAEDQIKAKDEQIKALEAEIKEAKAALEDPAFAQASGGEGNGESVADGTVSWEHYQTLKGEAKVSYYREHKAELLK